ncbi:MAG: OmpA family protein [Spirochaetota bacterium]
MEEKEKNTNHINNANKKINKSKILAPIFFVLFLLALGGLIAVYFFLYNPTASELASLKAKYEEKVTQYNELISTNSELNQKLDRANKKIGEKEADITKLTSKITELDDLVGNLDEEKIKLEYEKEDLETQKEQLESARNKLLTSIESTEEEKLNLAEELKKQREEIERLRNINDDLAKKFEEEIQKGDITISRVGEKLSLEVSNKILFEIGSAKVNKEGETVLKKVAEVLKDIDDKFIQIAGHTDNIPISGNVTNWELASARAINVVKLLQNEGVNPENMYAASFGEYHPKVDNTTEEGRALNRRIDIELLPKPETQEETEAADSEDEQEEETEKNNNDDDDDEKETGKENTEDTDNSIEENSEKSTE